MEKIKMAICYDFDKTLSVDNMQSYSFIKALNMNIGDFWKECNDFSNKTGADGILSYMFMSLKKCKENNIAPTREFFASCGKDIQYFDGIDTWFDRINAFAEKNGIELEHYIISSGIKEIIEGTAIAKYFKEIYACSYCYDEKGNAVWPATDINYTNKTQYIYRVNKGILKANDDSVNDYMNYEDRRIPFENIIYIGDSETDIPSMKLLRSKNGFSISVYNNSNLPDYYKALLSHNRVDYIARADYSKGSELEMIIHQIIKAIYHKDKLRTLNRKQRSAK